MPPDPKKKPDAPDKNAPVAEHKKHAEEFLANEGSQGPQEGEQPDLPRYHRRGEGVTMLVQIDNNWHVIDATWAAGERQDPGPVQPFFQVGHAHPVILSTFGRSKS